MRTLAAVDLGAQSGRVAAGRFDGERLVVEDVHRFDNVPVEDGAVLRWDLGFLRDEVRNGLRKQARDSEVASLAVDSWAVDFGLLDADGRLMRNPSHYRDGRRAAAFDVVLEQLPGRALYNRTGIQLLPINTLFELSALAAASDSDLAQARRLLLIPDIFHHWLCGSETTEWTNATTTQCLDSRTGEWAWDVLEQFHIPGHLFPEVVDPGTILGPVNADGRADTGLSEITTVVAGATHDTASAVAAVPMLGENAAYLSVGTWSLVGIETDAPVITDASYAANLTNEGGVDGTYRVLRNITGLWLLHECRRAWEEAGRHYDYPELVQLARSTEPLQAFVDPNDARFLDPGDMPSRIRSYLAETGQTLPADDGAIVRCVLESLALKHAETVELLVGVTGRRIDELHVVGGGANNELLCRWTAEASGRPVLAGPVEATLLGNLLVQARALGELSSLAEGRAVVARSFAQTEYAPSDDERWHEARQRFGELKAAEVHA
jgi:rhamnulokinase